MTSKRHPVAHGQREGETPSTLRSIEVAEIVSIEHEPLEPEDPEQRVYYEPQPLVAVSDHKTLEIETIKLAQDIDPRKLPTELRLRPVSVVPPSDSGWPQSDVVIVSSQPPSAGRRRWRAPAVLLVLLGVLLSLVLARVIARRWQSVPLPMSVTAQTGAPAANEGALPSVPPESAALQPTAAALPELTAPEAAESAAAPGPGPAPSATAADAAASDVAPPPARAPAKPTQHGHRNPTPNANSRAVAAPSVGKPKRAIY